MITDNFWSNGRRGCNGHRELIFSHLATGKERADASRKTYSGHQLRVMQLLCSFRGSPELGTVFHLLLNVSEHTQVYTMNDCIRPKLPIGHGPKAMLIPSRSFQPRPAIWQRSQQKLTAF